MVKALGKKHIRGATYMNGTPLEKNTLVTEVLSQSRTTSTKNDGWI